jgi:hypothetical protein
MLPDCGTRLFRERSSACALKRKVVFAISAVSAVSSYRDRARTAANLSMADAKADIQQYLTLSPSDAPLAAQANEMLSRTQ